MDCEKTLNDLQLSVVTTLYHSAPYLPEFYRRASEVARKITDDYEIIMVNDGSPDNSLEVAVALYEKDDHVRVIDLSRNFGHHKAIMTGLAHACGRLVFLVDCDLEEEPELVARFQVEMTSSGADVVYGIQEKRKGAIFEQVTGHLFYSVFNWFSSYPVPRNITTARLMSARYVSSLVEHKDREINLLGLWAITGYKQVPLTIKKHSKGSTTYNFGRKVAALVNSLTSFSNRPLVFIFYLGCLISMASIFAAGYLIVRRIFFGTYLEGWASLIVSIWLLGGLMIFCLGIIGIYISKIFTECKQRPYTVIRKSYERAGQKNNT